MSKIFTIGSSCLYTDQTAFFDRKEEKVSFLNADIFDCDLLVTLLTCSASGFVSETSHLLVLSESNYLDAHYVT